MLVQEVGFVLERGVGVYIVFKGSGEGESKEGESCQFFCSRECSFREEASRRGKVRFEGEKKKV